MSRSFPDAGKKERLETTLPAVRLRTYPWPPLRKLRNTRPDVAPTVAVEPSRRAAAYLNLGFLYCSEDSAA
jgi:hypothetical protein